MTDATESPQPGETPGSSRCQTANPETIRPQRGATRDFGDLARRISTWTTNLLAIGVLAIAALAMAGRITEWWRAEPPTAAAPPPDLAYSPWDAAGGMVLEFGDQPWSIDRWTRTGSIADAAGALLEQCRDLLNEPLDSEHLPAADSSERDLIRRLKNIAPMEEVPNRWRLYVIGGPLPWIVGTTAAAKPDSGGSQADRETDDAGPASRLLCWGLALPQPDQTWTLYVIDRRPADRRGASLPDVPLPPGARRSLRVSSAEGGMLTTFSGNGPATQWMVELDEALAAGGWQRQGNWSGGGPSHAASYQRNDDSGLMRQEITLTQGPDGRWLGVAEAHLHRAGPATESNAP